MPSAPRSTACSVARSRAGTAARAMSPSTAASRSHAERTGRRHGATSCCLRCTRCRSTSAGSVPGALNYVCSRLTVPPADAYGVATFYALLSVDPRPATVVHVCEDLACRCCGAEALISELEERFGPEGTVGGDGATWLRSPCLGQCDRAPAAMLTVAGPDPREHVLAPVDTTGVLDAMRGEPVDVDPVTPLPQEGRPELRLLRRIGRIEPTSLDDYRAHGGYEALRRAFALGQEGVLREVLDSKLHGTRGRRLPDGPQVGGRRPSARPAALPGLQRRRIRARHVQGPRDRRGRPVLPDRGDDDRRLRDELRARLRLPPRRVPAGSRDSRGGARERPDERFPRT